MQESEFASQFGVAGDVNSKFSNFLCVAVHPANDSLQQTLAHNDLGECSLACVSDIPKFWGVGTMVMAMGVV